MESNLKILLKQTSLKASLQLKERIMTIIKTDKIVTLDGIEIDTNLTYIDKTIAIEIPDGEDVYLKGFEVVQFLNKGTVLKLKVK